MAVKYCVSCGSEYQPGQRFCQNCGAELMQATAIQEPEINKAKKVPFVAIGIIIAIVAVGIGIFAGVVLHQEKTPKDNRESAKQQMEEGKQEEAADVKSENVVKARKAYQKVLNIIMQENRLEVVGLPQKLLARETLLDDDASVNGEEKDRFALVDIDGDGRQELLFTAMNTISANMGTYVMKYNDKTGKVEFVARFFMPTFYVNRDVKSGFTHMPEPAIDGFVYNRYNSKKNKWDSTDVVRYEKEMFFEDSDYVYPEKEDKNKNGVVYVRQKWSAKDNKYIVTEYIDDDKYPEWENKLLSSKTIKIYYKDFTNENIKEILKTSVQQKARKKEKKQVQKPQNRNPDIDENVYKKIEGNWETVGQSQRPVVIKDYKIFFYNKGESSPEGYANIISARDYGNGIYIYKIDIGSGGKYELVMGDAGNDEDLLTYYDDYASKEGYSMSSSLLRK